MVSESCQTNGLVSPPGQHPGPTQPPQHWFQSLHRPHHRHLPSDHSDFHVQVYNLDSDTHLNSAAKVTEFVPQRTSTPLGSCNGNASKMKDSGSGSDHLPQSRHVPTLPATHNPHHTLRNFSKLGPNIKL